MRVFLNCVVLVVVGLALSAGQVQAETVLSDVAALQATSGFGVEWGYPPSNAVSESRFNFMHSDGSGTTWWRVDLGMEYAIDSLLISSRRDWNDPAAPERVNGATLRAYAANGVTQVGGDLTLAGHTLEAPDVVYDNGVSGWTGVRYFQVNEPTNDVYLNIAEFKALAQVQTYLNFITGVTATGQNTYGGLGTDPSNLVNNRGMDDQRGLLGDPNASHYATWGDSLCHSDGANPLVVTFDLGGPHDLANMVVWNEHQAYDGAGARGVKEALIEVSTDGTNFTALADTNGAELGNYTLHPVAGAGPYYAATDNLGLGGVVASHVRLTAQSSFGSPYVGLDQVRFYEVPEPSMIVLLAFGSLVLLWRRK